MAKKLTPLHKAVIKGEMAAIQHLIADGADVNAQCTDNMTPLHLAASSGKWHVIEPLIHKGANVYARSSLLAQTPLHMAAGGGELEVVAAFIADRMDINVRDGNGKTPLDLAKSAGRSDVVAALEEETNKRARKSERESEPQGAVKNLGSQGELI